MRLTCRHRARRPSPPCALAGARRRPGGQARLHQQDGRPPLVRLRGRRRQEGRGRRRRELRVQDVQFDANLTITTIDTIVGDGVKGIAIVVPDKALGPVVAKKAKAAGIPLSRSTTTSTTRTAAGALCRHERLQHRHAGRRGDRRQALQADGLGRDKEVRIASIEDHKADTCMQRNRGAEEAFLKAVPGLQAREHRPHPLRQHDGQRDRRDDHHADRQSDRRANWVFFSCNDDGVLGRCARTENAGYSADQGMGVGIDGCRACEAFGSGKPIGFSGTMWLNSANHGALAVKLPARIDQGRDGPAGSALPIPNTSPPPTSPRTTRRSSALELPCASPTHGGRPDRLRRAAIGIDHREHALTQSDFFQPGQRLEAVRRRPGARQGVCRVPAGRTSRAGRRERCRQVDDDAHPRGRAPARQRHGQW